jgi:endo-1,4-beta-xylanase
MPFKLRATILALCLPLISSTAKPEAEIPSLRELGAARGLEIGTAVKASALADDSSYQETLLKHFSVITPENEMKLKSIERRRGELRFSLADSIVEFAQRHNLRVRGHTLIWNGDQHSTDWLLKLPADKETAKPLMREIITRMMNRYRGQIRDWDVVNEAVSNDNRKNAAPFVDGYWIRSLGPDYIAQAFHFARAADPNARLFYNDYDHGDSMGSKSNRIYELLKNLKTSGVPIDGVGLQMHCSLKKPPQKQALVDNFHRLKALGLIVQVTELDVEIMDDPAPLEDKLARQATIYRTVFEAALETQIEAIITWGFSDKFRHTALLRRKQLPETTDTLMGLFDADYLPKPAFHAITEALRAPGH